MPHKKPHMPGPATNDVVFDDDNPEWTKEDFKKSLPPEKLFDKKELEVLRNAFPKMRGPQKMPKKVPVSIRLTPEVVERFKAGGPGWQARIDAVLKKAVGL
jgi:uncharacterized protein (DUF4415 family)